MNSDVRKHIGGVACRILGACALLAVLVIAGCGPMTPPALTVTTTSSALPAGIVNVAYTPATLAAANGTGSLAWTVFSGSMPTGMSLSAAGVISGTPTASGTYNFTVQVTDSATPAPNKATAQLTILVNPDLQSVTFNPASVTGGTNSTGTVTLSGPAVASAMVTLSSNNSAAAVPASVTVAAGSSTGTFTATTTAVSTSATATITGTYGVPKSGTLTVNPPTVASVTLTAGTLTGGTGTTSGIVTLTGPAATGGDAVTLSSNNGAAIVPGTVTVLANQTSATFNVTTTTVTSSQTATIQASYNSSSKTTNLTVVPAPSITSFAAAAGSITSGNSTTLTGVFANGTGSVNGGVGAVTSGQVVTVQPTATTTYTLTVTNAAGAAVTATATVTVVAAPTITSFAPVAATITSGLSGTTLTAVFANGTGSVDNAVGAVTSGQAVSVNPATTTTYTLTVTNGAGTTITKQTTITVVPPPVATSLTPGAATITSGTSTTLTPIFSNGTGSINGVGNVTSGQAVTVQPTATTIYTLTVTNAAGATATTAATVTVVAAPTITSFAPTAATITSGLSGTTLTAVFANGTGSVDNAVGAVTSGQAVSVNPATTTTYTLTVTNGAGTSITAQATVNVVPPPVITSFTAGSSTIVQGNSTTLNPVFTGGTGIITNNVDATTITATSGTAATVTPSATTTYTLTVKNTATTPASTTATATVTVDIPPAITSASTKTFVINSFNTFTVQTTGFPTPALTYTGTLPSGVGFVDNGNGTATISGTPTGSANSYTLTITANNGVSPNATQTLTLTTSLVVAPAFTSANNVTFTAGVSSSFNVTTTGSPTPVLSETGGLPGTVTFHDNGNGTATISGSAPSIGQSVITITASNSAGSPQQTFTLNVVAAPVITSFTPSPGSITVGSPSTLTAVFSGGTGSVDNGVGTVTSNVGHNVSPTTTTTYTLTVTNAATTPASVTATATVNVYPAPAIASFTATSTTIALGSSTTLTPTFSNGTGTINTITGNVTSGTGYSVQPSVTTTYTLTVTNSAGSSTTSTVTVTVIGPPTISKAFGANAITLGGSTTLSFTIQNSNPANTLTGVAFSDTLAGGLVVSSTPAVTNSCAGTVTASAGASLITLSGGALAAGTSCNISVSVTGNTAGTISNTTSTVTSNEGGTGAASNTVSLTVLAAPAVTQVSPNVAGTGASIIVSGSNFGPSQGSVSGSVTVNGVSATVTSWSSSSLTVTVPSTATGSGFVVVTVLGVATATGPSSAFTVQTCTTNCTFSGNMSLNSSGFANLTLTLTGPSPSTTAVTSTTDASGNFAFTNLTGGGSYTLTAPAGYNYSPAMPYTFTINSNTTQNFTATPTNPSSTITGTVSYSGTKTGRVYIRAYMVTGCSPSCGNNAIIAATSFTFPQTSSPYSGSFTLNGGLSPGFSYNIVAEIDNQNNGVPNASNPNGLIGPITPSQLNQAVGNIVISDPTPPAPVAPCGINLVPGASLILVQYNQGGSSCPSLTDSNGREIDTQYEIDWATNSTFTTGLGTETFPAHGAHDNNYIISGLTTGSTYYVRMYGIVGSTKSAASTAASMATVAGTGTNTVSGTVSFNLPQGVSSPGGPLFVGLFNGTQIYGEKIPTPYSSGVSYSIPNVPAGTYQAFAIVKMDTSGVIEFTDISNLNNRQGGPPSITVSGSTTNNISLTSAVSTMEVMTYQIQFMTNIPDTGAFFGVGWGSDRPVAVQLFSGPSVPLPWDLPMDNTSGPSYPFTPNVGDSYQYNVTLYNPRTQATTTQIMTGTVTAVLGYANNMQINTPVNSTSITPDTVPMFNWAAPSPVPTRTPYIYQLGIFDSTNSSGVNWSYSGGNNSNGIPSTTTNVQFNSDGMAQNGSALTPGVTYDWYVAVQDADGNMSQYMTTYIPSNGAGPAAKLAFTQQPGDTTAGSTIPNFQVTVQDANGLTVLNANNAITVSLSNNPGGATLGGNLTVIAVNGVATFSGISINNAGTGYTLTASVSGNTLTAATSAAFNVAGSPTHLAWIIQPGNATPNGIIPASEVAVEDASNNVVTNSADSISIAIGTNAGGGTLSGTTPVTAVNGVATFSDLSINNPGSGYTLAATDNSNGSVNGATSNTFNVAASCPMTVLGHESLLNGTYVALLNGFEDANGPSRAVMAFTANGSGSITGGEIDYGSVLNYSGGAYQTPLAPVNATILSSGSCYQLGSDNRGMIALNLGGSKTATYAFSIRNDGALGRLIEFDDANPSSTGVGSRSAGLFQKRTISGPFSLSNLNGSFALGLTGYNNDNCTSSICTGGGVTGYQPLSVVGRLTSNGAGAFSNFVFDVAQVNGGTPSTQSNVDSVSVTSSSYTAADSFGRGTFTMSGNDSRLGGAFTVNFAYYLIDATHVFLQSTDAPINGPFFSGEAIGQSGTFSAASLNGNAVFSMTGGDITNNSYTVNAAGRVTGNGTGSNVSTLMDKVSNGTVVNTGTTAITGGTFTASSNGMGVLTIASGQTFSVAMYAANAGFLLEGTQASPGTSLMFGLMQPQTTPSGGWTTSSTSGLFIEGNGAPSTTNADVETGSVTLTPSTTSLSGTSDNSSGLYCASGCLSLNKSISGTYSIDSNGRLTVISKNNIYGWLTSITHGALIDGGNTGLIIQLDQ